MYGSRQLSNIINPRCVEPVPCCLERKHLARLICCFGVLGTKGTGIATSLCRCTVLANIHVTVASVLNSCCEQIFKKLDIYIFVFKSIVYNILTLVSKGSKSCIQFG